MKRILLFAFLCLLSIRGISQENQIIEYIPYSENSWWSLLHSDSDSTRLKTLNNLANYHKFSRPDSGIYYATKGLEFAREIGDKEQELKALSFLSLSYSSLGNTISGYRISLEGLRKAEEYDSDQKGLFLMHMGRVMLNIRNFDASIDYIKKANEEFYRVDNEPFISVSFGNLARAFNTSGQRDSAFFYGYKAKGLAEALDMIWVKSFVYAQLGRIHSKYNNIDSALYYLNLSMNVRTYDKKSVDLLQAVADLHLEKQQPDSALLYAKESLNIALTNKRYENVSKSAMFFSDFYEKKDPAKALQYQKMARSYKDSLDLIRQMTGFADLIQYDDLLREADRERSELEFQAKLRTYVFVGSIFVLLLIASFLYRNNRIKHKARLQIEEAYHQLKSTQTQLIHAEKMASLGELTAGIAHEIQNPLNFVNNFSELSSELVDEMVEELDKGETEEAKAIGSDIKSNLEKINHHGKRADAIVKGMLAHSRTGKGEKELTDINQLADEYLRLSYHGLRAKDPSFNAEFKTDFDPDLPKVNVIPQDIGRVLLNLINNAFQACTSHGDRSAPLSVRAESEGPLVSVSTKRIHHGGQAEGGIQISVSDNGPGIPDNIKDKIFQPFFTTKPTGQGTGLGLSLSYDIIKAHNGELTVSTIKNEKTVFSIQLPQ